MICPNCKKDIADDSIFCSGCGLKIGGQLPETKNKKINAKGIAVVIVSNKGGSSLAYIKATEAGKAFSNMDEAAFGHRFFLVTVVASLLVGLIGLFLYFFDYFL